MIDGPELKRQREALGLSRRAAARLSGVDHVTIWRIELGQSRPQTRTMEALESAYAMKRRAAVAAAERGC